MKNANQLYPEIKVPIDFIVKFEMKKALSIFVLPIFILLIWRPTLLSASAERDAFPASFVLLMFGLVAASVPSLFSEAAAAC